MLAGLFQGTDAEFVARMMWIFFDISLFVSFPLIGYGLYIYNTPFTTKIIGLSGFVVSYYYIRLSAYRLITGSIHLQGIGFLGISLKLILISYMYATIYVFVMFYIRGLIVKKNFELKLKPEKNKLSAFIKNIKETISYGFGFGLTKKLMTK